MSQLLRDLQYPHLLHLRLCHVTTREDNSPSSYYDDHLPILPLEAMVHRDQELTKLSPRKLKRRRSQYQKLRLLSRHGGNQISKSLLLLKKKRLVGKLFRHGTRKLMALAQSIKLATLAAGSVCHIIYAVFHEMGIKYYL